MLLPQTYFVTLVLMLCSVACWGTWPNAYRLSRGTRLEYLHFNFGFGVVITALAAALLLGLGHGKPDFIDDLRRAGLAPALWAAAGGMCLNAGNLLLAAGVARVGLAIAFPIAVGLSLVVSTVLCYWINPAGEVWLLGGGVALVLLAVLTNSAVARTHAGNGGAKSFEGLLMCLGAGILFSSAGPMVAKALSPPYSMGAYGASLVYGLGSLAAELPLMLILSAYPLGGEPLRASGYFALRARDHGAGLLAGALWGAGMVTSFAAAGHVGMAVAGAMGQANSLVAALWGIVVWKEFRGASRLTWSLLALMVVLYVAGLLLLSRSATG